MNDKYAKEIAKELKLIRRELQKDRIEIEEGIIKELKQLKEDE